jgi:iron complex outermembrane receptor protein
VTETVDILRTVPNLIGNNNVGLGSSNTYYIRGIGNTESIPTQDVPVGTYVDDVYIARQNANNFGLFDVDRIEVLRGPQGTLFGRNTTGGAINVILKKPSTNFGGYVDAALGRFNHRELRGTVDLPINEQLLTKFSAYGLKTDGYATQTSTGKKLNGESNYGFRGAVRYLPRNDLTIDLSADYVNQDDADLLNRIVNGQRVVNSGIVKDSLASYFVGEKAHNDPGNQTQSTSVTANVKWDFNPSATLSAITGYRRTDQHYYIDSIFTAPNPLPTGVSPILDYGTNNQFSEEVRVNGRALGNRLNYVAGLYYLNERNWTDLGTGAGTATSFTVTGDRRLVNTLASYAAYAQGDYSITDKLTGTIGLRYTLEDKHLDVATNPGAKGPIFSSAAIAASGIPLELKHAFLTPRFALQYQIEPDLMVYASATRGEKSGGWNGRALANNLFLAFKPEKVWSEEIGVRSDLLNHTLRINATAFYAKTDDLQISAATRLNGLTIFTTTNPAGLQNYGGELEITWLPIPKLTLQSTLGVQHARYQGISPDVQTQIAACQAAIASGNVAANTANCNRGFVDYKGRIAIPVRAPDVSLQTFASYQIDLPVVSVTPSAGFQFNNGYTIGNAGNFDSIDGAFTKSQMLWDAAVQLTPQRYRNVSLTVECKNCFDRAYNVSFLTPTSIYLNPPGTWDVRLRYTF